MRDKLVKLETQGDCADQYPVGKTFLFRIVEEEEVDYKTDYTKKRGVKGTVAEVIVHHFLGNQIICAALPEGAIKYCGTKTVPACSTQVSFILDEEVEEGYCAIPDWEGW